MTHQWIYNRLTNSQSQVKQSKPKKIVPSPVPVPLDAYTIAMMYWEKEKYMFPPSEWHLHEPRQGDFVANKCGNLRKPKKP
jgi:hypothetical protein